MECEVIPRSSEICDSPLNLYQDHFVCIQKKNVRVTMELEDPKRPIFVPILSSIMVQRILRLKRGKRGSLAGNVRGHGKEMSL